MGKRVVTIEKGKLRDRDLAREESLAREAPFLPGS